MPVEAVYCFSFQPFLAVDGMPSFFISIYLDFFPRYSVFSAFSRFDPSVSSFLYYLRSSNTSFVGVAVINFECCFCGLDSELAAVLVLGTRSRSCGARFASSGRGGDGNVVPEFPVVLLKSLQ